METCKWKNQEEMDGIDSHYSTECGTFQWFEGGGIVENHYVFCPYCGRVIVGGLEMTATTSKPTAAHANKIKLKHNEVVKAETYMQATKICLVAHSLGLKWLSGDSYLNVTDWGAYKEETVYEFHEGFHGGKTFSDKRKPISMVEWLNRHGIFVRGQEVLVDGALTILLHDSICVAPGWVNSYNEGGTYETETARNIVSPYPAWEDMSEVSVEVNMNGELVQPNALSEEMWLSLRKEE